MKITEAILQSRIEKVIECVELFNQDNSAWNYLRKHSVEKYLLIKSPINNSGTTHDYCFPDFPKTLAQSSSILPMYDEYKSYLKRWDKDIAETFSEYWVLISSHFMTEEAFIDISNEQLPMIVGEWVPNKHMIKIACPSIVQFVIEYMGKQELEPLAISGLSLIGHSYISVVESIGQTLKGRDNLNVLLTRLPDLKLDSNYVLDDFRSRQETNSILRLYARDKALKRPCDTDFENSKNNIFHVFGGNRSHSKVWMTLKMWGFTVGKIRKSITLNNPFQYITVPFTEEAIWQAYLLENTYHVVGMRWHGYYERRTFINSYADIENLRIGTKAVGMKEKISSLWNPELYPSVVLKRKCAYITHCWFNDWGGFEQVNCEVIYNPDKKQILSFQMKEVKVLVPYNCGIRY